MKTKIFNNILIYYPEGRIRNDSAEEFEHRLERLIDHHGSCDLILNMEGVPSISSNGIAVLISIAQKMKAEDRIFSICSAKDLAMKIISILNIGSFIAVYNTEEEAVTDLLKEIAQV